MSKGKLINVNSWDTTVGGCMGYIDTVDIACTLCVRPGKKHIVDTVLWTSMAEKFIPTRVIYNVPYAICYFPDGTKEISKCRDDELDFVDEVGVMACIMKKMFPSRKAFEKLVANGKWQYNDGGLMQDDTYGGK